MKLKRTARRAAATLTVVSLAGLVSGLSPARAATPSGSGVGSTASSQSVLDLALGDLLGAKLLNDSGQSQTKDAVKALAQMSGLTLSSKTVPALNLSIPTSPIKAEQPGGAPSQTSSVSLSQTLSAVPALSSLSGLGAVVGNLGVANGDVLPMGVTAAIGNLTSGATGTASLASLSLVDGIVDVKSLASNVKQGSGTDASSVDRGLKVDALGFLNLGSLLGGQIPNLSVADLSTLLNSVKAVVQGLPAGQTLAQVLNPLIDTLSAAVNTPTATVGSLSAPIQSTITGLLGSSPASTTPVGDLTDLPDLALDDILGMVQNAIKALFDTPLLRVTAIDLSALAKATDAVNTSAAKASCSLGSVQVGNLPAINISTLTGGVQQLVSTVSGVLSNLPLGLGKLINLSICGQTILGAPGATGVTQSVTTSNTNNVAAAAATTAGQVVTATAGISAVSLKVDPGAVLSGLSGTPITQVISGLGGDATDVSSITSAAAPLGPLSGVLGGATSLLTTGVSLDVAKVTSIANHTVQAQGTPATPAETPALPRTGGNLLPFGVSAALLALLALSGRSALRRSRSLR